MLFFLNAAEPVMRAAMIALFIVMVLTVLTLFALVLLSYEKEKDENKNGAEILPKDEEPILYDVGENIIVEMDLKPLEEPASRAIEYFEEESFSAGAVRYDRSFMAKLIQSDDATKCRYTQLKNYFLSFSKVKDKMSWKHESFRLGREQLAKFIFRGKTLCILFPLPLQEFQESKFKMESCGDDEHRCLYRVKSDLRCRYAKELFEALCKSFGAVPIERESVDYFLPYEGVVELIDKGLIKRKITSKETEEFLRA